MNKKTALRILISVWPLIVGLIIGGLIGGIRQSWFAAFFYGGIGAVIASRLLHSEGEWRTPSPEGYIERVARERSLGAGGIEPYATLYGYNNDDLFE